MPGPFYAHSGDHDDCGDWQLLSEHLKHVAQLARRFAEEACPDDAALHQAAHAAGLLHDLGKYRVEFQQMLKRIPVQREKTYHKQAGAAKAAVANQVPIAFGIAGHHGGVPDQAGLKDLIKGESGKTIADLVWPDATSDCPELGKICYVKAGYDASLGTELSARLVFSCLVDADWSDTGEHERQRKGWPEDPKPTGLAADEWLQLVLGYIAGKSASCPDQRIKEIRSDILEACLNAADEKPGLFTLTVPTGGGKTLSGLAFALKHAAAHEHRRVIYVAPYLSILDQNANEIRKALAFDKYALEVFEHHSLAEPPADPDPKNPKREDQNQTRREAAARRAENWDAPIVITTSVQFYESLFSNKPGQCRKLHNIARSVILLDECQTLPPDLVAPTCAMLKQLTTLGCTIVFCTATQPAFDHGELKEHERLHASEIIPSNLDLFSRLRRVTVKWPATKGEALTWEELADKMRSENAALCIVNSKRAAREMFSALKELGKHAFHLSTSMCPAHRLDVLAAVKDRLKNKKPVYLVSTQLIEAGVDIDFPFVLREMAPLEAIIQAAGRCNREGLIADAGGQVLVFRSKEALAEPKKYYPLDRWYKAGREKVEQDFLAAGRLPRIDVADDIQDYFTRLYQSGKLDEKNIDGMRMNFQFQTAADAYSLIDDNGVPVIVASWKQRKEEVAELIEEVRRKPNRSAFRKLVPFQVNVRQNQLQAVGRMIEFDPLGLHIFHGSYDAEIGLSEQNADELLIV